MGHEAPDRQSRKNHYRFVVLLFNTEIYNKMNPNLPRPIDTLYLRQDYVYVLRKPSPPDAPRRAEALLKHALVLFAEIMQYEAATPKISTSMQRFVVSMIHRASRLQQNVTESTMESGVIIFLVAKYLRVSMEMVHTAIHEGSYNKAAEIADDLVRSVPVQEEDMGLPRDLMRALAILYCCEFSDLKPLWYVLTYLCLSYWPLDEGIDTWHVSYTGSAFGNLVLAWATETAFGNINSDASMSWIDAIPNNDQLAQRVHQQLMNRETFDSDHVVESLAEPIRAGDFSIKQPIGVPNPRVFNL